LAELLDEEVDEVVGPMAAAVPTGRRCATATRPARSGAAAGA
jgi:hypothetical protein